MQNDRAARPLTQHKEITEKRGELVALPATPSFSLGDASTILDIEVQADQLLDYINRLTTLADRACDTAIRQTETTQLIEENRFTEIGELRKKLDQQNENFHQQQMAIIRLEQESKARIAALESQLRDNEAHRHEAQELETLRRENARLIQRLNETQATPTEQAQPSNDQLWDALNKEIVDLKSQLASRDETIQAKNNALKSSEHDYRAKIVELEQRLRDVQAELHKQEENLKEKDALIQATASKEAEMGNLIKRLSAECTALSNELQAKSQAPAAKSAKSPDSAVENKLWRRVVGRLQEES
jgi:DNA repair exonuclease SbcCD ATPase subunit